MRLISILDIADTALDEEIFRNSNIANIVVFTILFVPIIVCTYLFISKGYYHNTPIWGFFVYLWIVFWLGLIAWGAWSRFRACLRPTNWLLRLSSNRVLIKYRSFQNLNYTETDPVVIELSWRDIIWVRKTKETASRVQGDSAVTEFFTYLDIKLNLSEAELEAIAAALNEERRRKSPSSEVSDLQHELFLARKNKVPKSEILEIKDRIRLAKANKKSSQKISGVKHHDYPVKLTDSNVLRVRWNGIKPKVTKALESFSLRTSIESEVKINSDSTVDSLKGKELDDMILDRISRGDTFDALALVKKHYGYTANEARQFIDELNDGLSK